ncbi:HNH endonuclease family protein [Jatrophihabitans fulvus]
MRRSLTAVLLTAAALVAALLTAAPASAASFAAPLNTLISDLKVDDTAHSGYDRTLFKLWIDADGDGCDTREEVLKAEAVTAPTQGSGCTLSGGSWKSWYDGATWTDKSDVDIDHVVPLGEVWTSGGYQWSAARRQAYANDLGDFRTLEAVTDNVNQSKGDKDPAEWMPPLTSVRCKYVIYWVAVKTRWGLTADDAEISALKSYASSCGNPTVDGSTA